MDNIAETMAQEHISNRFFCWLFMRCGIGHIRLNLPAAYNYIQDIWAFFKTAYVPLVTQSCPKQYLITWFNVRSWPSLDQRLTSAWPALDHRLTSDWPAPDHRQVMNVGPWHAALLLSECMHQSSRFYACWTTVTNVSALYDSCDITQPGLLYPCVVTYTVEIHFLNKT